MLKSAKNNQMFASKSKGRILLSKASFTGKSMALILLLSLASLDSTNPTSTIQQQRMPLSCSPEKKPSNPLPEGPVMQHMLHKTAHGLRTQIKDQLHQTLFPAGEAGLAGPFPSIGLKQASSMLATDSNFSLPSPSSDATHAIILNNSAGGDADEAGLAPSYALDPPSSPMLLVGQSVCRETAMSGQPGQQPCAGGPFSVDSKCVKSCPQHCYEDILQNIFFRLGNLESELSQINTGLSTRLTEINTGLTEINTGLTEIKTGLTEIKTGLNEIRTEHTKINTELSQIQTERTETKTGLNHIKTGLTQINARVSDLEKETFGLCRIHARVAFWQIIQRLLGRHDLEAGPSNIFEKAYNSSATNHLVTAFLVDGLSITDTSAHCNAVQHISK